MAGISVPKAPGEARAHLQALSVALDGPVSGIPAKALDRNLLLATWDLADLDDYAPSWHMPQATASGQRSRRNLLSIAMLASIISRFDIVAIQAVRGNARAVPVLMEMLGPSWALMLTDVNLGRAGNNSRLGFLYDTRRATATGLGGEIALPADVDGDDAGDPFARAPYVAGFRIGNATLTVATAHTVWGDGATPARQRELSHLFAILQRWQKRGSSWERNLVLAGNLNINKLEDELYTLMITAGFVPPADVVAARRTIYKIGTERQFSQIAWNAQDFPAELEYRRGGAFNWTGPAAAAFGDDKRTLRFSMTDHLPLWAEFGRVEQLSPQYPHTAEAGPPPKRVQRDLDRLGAALDDPEGGVPPKLVDRDLLIATWNIKAFGGLNSSWRSKAGSRPRRDLQALRTIARIIERFDVVAIQEAKANHTALRALKDELGDNFDLILSDVTRGNLGNDERMAFVFDRRRVSLSGLACQLVLPPGTFADDGVDQWARTPFAVGFRVGDRSFTLVSLHVLFKTVRQRAPEVAAIAQWMHDWVTSDTIWDPNVIVLGDLNIPTVRSELYTAFTSAGLTMPDEMNNLRRTLAARPTLYDQIAWFDGREGTPALGLDYLQCGSFDFSGVAMRSIKPSRPVLESMISDHLPLWARFAI